MEHVDVEVAERGGPLALFLEDALRVVQRLHVPRRHLVREEEALAWILHEYLVQELFAVAAVVDVARIEEVHAVAVAVVEDLRGELAVDPVLVAVLHAQAHAAAAEEGDLP